MLASFPLAYRSSYTASKAALKGFSDGARHEYSPFDVYAKALYELLQHRELTASEWEKSTSRIYPILAPYQRNGYHDVLAKGYFLVAREAFRIL